MSFFHGTCPQCGHAEPHHHPTHTPAFGALVVSLVAAELGLRENNITGGPRDDVHNNARASVTWVMRQMKCTWAQCGRAIKRANDSAYRSSIRWSSPDVLDPARVVLSALASIREKASA